MFTFITSCLLSHLQFIKDLAHLEELRLGHNLIKTLDDADFANMANLKRLDLAHNEVETVSETAFQNSTQLQFIDLGCNSIDTFLVPKLVPETPIKSHVCNFETCLSF